MSRFRSVDVQNIFHKMEQRTLAAAYKFYCGRELTNAHSADADTRATYEVLLGQLEKYEELENDVKFLSEFSQRKNAPADLAGFIVYDRNRSGSIRLWQVPRTAPWRKSWTRTQAILPGCRMRTFRCIRSRPSHGSNCADSTIHKRSVCRTKMTQCTWRDQ